jgi:hypothetical protein
MQGFRCTSRVAFIVLFDLLRRPWFSLAGRSRSPPSRCWMSGASKGRVAGWGVVPSWFLLAAGLVGVADAYNAVAAAGSWQPVKVTLKAITPAPAPAAVGVSCNPTACRYLRQVLQVQWRSPANNDPDLRFLDDRPNCVGAQAQWPTGSCCHLPLRCCCLQRSHPNQPPLPALAFHPQHV